MGEKKSIRSRLMSTFYGRHLHTWAHRACLQQRESHRCCSSLKLWPSLRPTFLWTCKTRRGKALIRRAVRCIRQKTQKRNGLRVGEIKSPLLPSGLLFPLLINQRNMTQQRCLCASAALKILFEKQQETYAMNLCRQTKFGPFSWQQMGNKR